MPKSSPSSAEPGAAVARIPPDYAAARTALAHRLRRTGILAIEGPDRVAFLQGQLTQDVSALSPGQSRPAAGLTPKGKLIYFGRVLAEVDRVLLLIPADARPAVSSHLSKYAVFQKVALRDVTAEFREIGLYGPSAAAFERSAETVRLPADGEYAACLLAPAERLEELVRRLADAGSLEVSEETALALRIEAGRALLGKDADGSNLPDEVGLAAAVSTTKGCYVGQEIVARLRTYGRVNRRLVGFRFPDQMTPEGTSFANPEKPDHELARVTSAVRSPRLGPIGLGLAFREIPDGGSLRDPAHPERVAVVSPLPFA